MKYYQKYIMPVLFLLAQIIFPSLTEMSVAGFALHAQTIKPGQTWKDTDGSAINAHGGCVVFHNGYYYWFGEQRNGSKSDGISCYRSSDLCSWTRLSRAVTPSGTKTDENRDIASGRTLERPKVVWNESTQKWVMWIHWENGSDYGQAKCAVCMADRVEGPYTLVDVFRPNNCDSRDQTLFLDTDGTAYHAYSTNMNSNTNIERLTPDFLRPEEDYEVQLRGRRFEAASLFKAGDIYYGLFSGCTGWDPNPGRYMWTYNLMGEIWNAPADFKASDGSTGINFCVDNGKNNTYQSQSNYVFPVPGKDKCFIYMGDRWNSSNVQNSKHVWLPLSVRSGYPAVRWMEEWDLSVFDDMYRMKRMQTIADGCEGYLLEKHSDRLVSRPKSSLTLEDDGETNLKLVFHITDRPYTYKIEDKNTGKYLESVFGTTRWQPLSDALAQEWVFWLEEDGYFRIENASDGVCLSVSGNSTEAGTTLYMAEASDKTHQSFAPYFDSVEHPEYEEADIWSRGYIEANREVMDRQEAEAGIGSARAGDVPAQVFDLGGRRHYVSTSATTPRGIYIVGGKKISIK